MPLKNENGRLKLDNISLIEYQNNDSLSYFLQVGIAGFNLTQDELDKVYAVLSYYKNIELINSCKLVVEE